MMDELNEASQGPSTETAVPEPQSAPEPSLDDELHAAYSRMQDEKEPPQDEATAEPTNEEAPADDAPAEPETQREAPSHLPHDLKQVWDKVPDEVGDMFASSYKALSDKFSTAQREAQGIAPIKGALVEAIRANPTIQNLKPEDVAARIPGIISIDQQLRSDPIGAVMAAAQQYGFADQLAAHFGGQQAPVQAMQKIAQLEKQLAEVADPAKLRETYDSWHRESTAEREIQNFADSAEHWADVEQHIPQLIPLAQAKLGEGTPERAVLEAAYEMAVNALMPEKAPKPEAADEAAPEPDPAKVQKAKDAKSVNVKSAKTGKRPELSLEDELGGVFDRMQA